MTVLTATRPAKPATTASTRTEATTWTFDVDHVSVNDVRRVVAGMFAGGSRWAQVRQLRTGRHRPMLRAEVSLWADAVVREAGPVMGDIQRAHGLGAQPLGARPFVVVVCSDAIVLRWDTALGGHVEGSALLRRLAAATRV